MSASLRALAATRLLDARPTVIVEVLRTRGSVPREAGTRMLVGPADLEGTIGGGRLEWEAIAKARAALDHPARWPADEEIALGASLGQCCGGAVTLRYLRLDQSALDAWSGPRLPLIQVYGAGHVGRAVVRLLETLDATVQWIDERSDAFPSPSPSPSPSTASSEPSPIERVCVEPVEAEVRIAPPGAYFLVLTHQHDLDLRIVEAVLRRADFGFLGLIGSRTKRRRFEQQLLARGIAADALARMTCPIGIDGIDGKEPPVIAVAAVAQLLRAMSAATALSSARSVAAEARR